MNCEVCGTALLRNGNCPGDECREARIRDGVARRVAAERAAVEPDEALAAAFLHGLSGRRRADVGIVASVSNRVKRRRDSRGRVRRDLECESNGGIRLTDRTVRA